MSHSIKPTQLNSLTFPLHGARLIEASAGTGKTYTITALYLRLLLGHGANGQAHQTQLTVDKILVVTFTEAATAELRSRIRQRIHDARLAFTQHVQANSTNNQPVTDDPFLQQLIKEAVDPKVAIQILLQAERQIDEAAIFTIHGFCQRMLTQNAFESGSRFQNEFITDESQIRHQVVSDYWRSHFYPLSHELTQKVSEIWPCPESLLSDIGHYLSGALPNFPVENIEQDIEALLTQYMKKINKIKSAWLASCDELIKLIQNSGASKRSYTKKNLPSWAQAVSCWAEQETTDESIPKQLVNFAQSTIIDKTDTTKGELAKHSVFEQIDTLLQEPSLASIFKYQAIIGCRARLAIAKVRQNVLSFDDLLSQLDSAITNDDEGILTERIRQLYPVAMIDEFQDTDPQQYRIFSQIYLKHTETGLFMIGDPKQAIYSFRNADIFTYIQARNEVVDHYTLGTNWRSSSDMIASVNALFQVTDEPFIYNDDIPFLPVESSHNADNMHWELENEKQKSLNFWLYEEDGEAVRAEDYRQKMAQSTAYQISAILTASKNGNAVFSNKKENKQAVKASDIAVLVRTGREAQLVKQALAQQGVASVYLSNRDSVFDSIIAQDILRLLVAVSNPLNDSALRAMLACGLLSLNSYQLDKYNFDENMWEEAVNEFEQYRIIWQKKGVMPMIRAVIAKRKIAELWLPQINGERVLTDLLHLAEIVQQASLSLDSDTALIRWLTDNIEQHSGDNEEQTQRLESERNLVQIITIHKSKGLEYNLVFLPFVCHFRPKKEALYHNEDDKEQILDLSKPADGLALAENERLAEDLRLLYVAITRAVYGCYIGLAPLKVGRGKATVTHNSAIGYLLQDQKEVNASELSSICDSFVEKNKLTMTFADLPTEPDHRYTPESLPYRELTALPFDKKIDRNWHLTSYSGLIKQSFLNSGQHAHGNSDAKSADLTRDFDATLDMEKPFDSEAEQDKNRRAISSVIGAELDDAPIDEQPAESEDKEPNPWTIFNFPRGARPGTFLHSIFEEIEFTERVDSEHNRQIIMRLLEKNQYEENWLPALINMVQQVLDTPLDGKQMRLSGKNNKHKLIEMEFLLPIESLVASKLNPLLIEHDELSEQAGTLNFYPAEGMLKGFIDLVFEHEGKYYVLDWKSNHLGDTSADYHIDNIKQTMIDHRYDFQYQLYALALHRFLETRIPNYDYHQHFGGVYYLFLRGFDDVVEMDKKPDYGLFYTRPSFELVTEMSDLIKGDK